MFWQKQQFSPARGAKIILALVFVGFLFLIWFASALLAPNSSSREVVTFQVEEGSGLNAISQKLFAEGLTQSKFVFETWVWLKKAEDKIIAGEYDLPRNMSIFLLTNRLVLGSEKPRDQRVTIIEGWTNEEIARHLESEGFGPSEDFLVTAKTPPETLLGRFPFLREIPEGLDLQGYLFPDTYRFFHDSTVNDILEKMLNNFEAKIDEPIMDEIKNRRTTLHEVLTLASIVEAEVRSVEDRKLVADIFWKRLDIGLPLQSDASINFITQSGRTRSTLGDLEVDSPYNTYKYPGLPPGPINNPSLDAIRAVLYPTSNEYYFFLTDEEGNVYYGRNEEEHNQNRFKYL